MALESSGGLRSSSSPIKLRSSLVVLSAGAALVALIGYLFMKSRQSPPASKQSSPSSSSSLSTTSSTTSTSKSEKSQVEEEEKQEEESLERISQEFVRIVLNCAAKKMANDSDDFTHLMSNESKRSESKRNRNRTSGGADETELDEATHELSMHSISLLETDSSSSSSAAEHTTSIIESPNASFHQETAANATSNQQTSANLTKSSSTTSTASTASSATVEPSQQQRQFTNKQTQSSKQQHNKKVSSQHQKTTNKPKPLNVHNRNTNDKHKPLPKSNHQMPESQEETQRQQQQQHHHESQPVSLNSSTTADANHEDIIVYEFNFPRKFCGKLIGKNGVHVDHIRSKTRTQIAVRDDADNHEQQIVCVSGRLEDVDQALDIISSRFPLKQYPTISFKPISKPIVYRRINNEVESDRVLPYESTSVKKVLVAPNMFVEIKPAAIEPMNVHVSAVVNASHVFVQFPDNSTYASLQKLDECMFEVYSRQSNNNESSSEEPVPIMSEPIEFGSICVAPTSYGWHRAMVTTYLSLDEARAQYADYGEECGLATVKFLDYGGYLTIPANQLRQLRSDFMLLPFQAVECYLDGIFVNQGTEEEGKKFLTEIIKGAQIKLSLCGYAEDGIPLIKLFLTNDIYQNVNLNSELINYSNNL